MVVIAYPYCNMSCFYIATLEEGRFSIKGSRANLASVDKHLDMMRTHRMIAVLADHHDRFCDGHPVVAHGGVSLSSPKFKVPDVSVMGESSHASGSNQGRK